MTDRLYDQGVDPVIEAEIQGHSVATAMKYYRKPTANQKREALMAIAGLPVGRVVKYRPRHKSRVTATDSAD